jgi:hypothetical protein
MSIRDEIIEIRTPRGRLYYALYDMHHEEIISKFYDSLYELWLDYPRFMGVMPNRIWKISLEELRKYRGKK